MDLQHCYLRRRAIAYEELQRQGVAFIRDIVEKCLQSCDAKQKAGDQDANLDSCHTGNQGEQCRGRHAMYNKNTQVDAIGGWKNEGPIHSATEREKGRRGGVK